MRFLIQRVNHASVTVDDKEVGKIGKGLLVFVGVFEEDTEEVADKLIRKLLGLRIFADENGKTNLSLTDVNGELLIVSQFTLCADCRKETAHLLQRQATLKKQMRYMNMSCLLAGKKSQLQKAVFLVRI